MKVLVTYFSRTGNTRKVAEAIFEEMPTPKELKDLRQTEGFDGYDLVFVGLPIEIFGPPKEAVSLLAKQRAGKKVALFATHAAREDAPQLPEWLAKCEATIATADLLGSFNCQGELGEQIANYMLKSPDERLVAWAKERPSTIGQPDLFRLQRARTWAKEVLLKCKNEKFIVAQQATGA